VVVALVLTGVRRLNWGCGRVTPSGWLNVDRKPGPGVDLLCDVREGLALGAESLDYAVSLGGKLAVQLLWYGALRSMYTTDFAKELCERAGFLAVQRCNFRETTSPYPEIIDLDNRQEESLFVEAWR